MKFTINVDCTPEEARAFLGLPDVQPVQQAVMDKLQERMMAAIEEVSAENLMKTWMPFSQPFAGAGTGLGGTNPLEEMQKAFFAQMTGKAAGKDD